MSMQPYDIIAYGRQWGFDNNSFASNTYLSNRLTLSNIVSFRGPAPYREFRPHAFLKIHMIKLPGWSHYQDGDYYLHWSGTSPDYPAQMAFDPLSGNRSTAISAAYTSALESLNDQIRGNTDLSIDLAQGSKSLRIGQDVSKIVRSILKFRKPLELIKGIGNARLAWVYGIKPTFQSLYDAVHHEAVHYNNEFAFSQGRGKDGGTGEASDTGAQWPDYTYKTSWSGSYQARVQLGIVMRIPDTPQTQIARLSSLNPVSIAWELVPFSFVVDWFVNIGGYLRDLETALTYSSYFVRGYKTTTTYTRYYFMANRAYTQFGVRRDGMWGMEITRKDFNRAILSSYPMPERPAFNANLGSGRLFNGAALLTIFLGKKGRKISQSGGGSAIQRAGRGFMG